MSKRAPGLNRRERDYYPSPPEVVIPLLPHLPKAPTYYVEPCAGDGALVRALEQHWPYGTCMFLLDIEPQAPGIDEGNAFEIDGTPAHLFITNPPWPSPGSRGEPVISLARHLMAIRPTWLLLPLDFAANAYFTQISDQCAKIQPIGRVSWMGNGTPSKDNAAWFLFDALHTGGPKFFARAA